MRTTYFRFLHSHKWLSYASSAFGLFFYFRINSHERFFLFLVKLEHELLNSQVLLDISLLVLKLLSIEQLLIVSNIPCIRCVHEVEFELLCARTI